MMKFLFYLCLLFLLFIPLSSNPASMGIALIISSFNYVWLMCFMSSWWYSYVLFLVFIGALLVLFIYFCLISSNYSFNSSLNFIIPILFSSVISYMISYKPMSKSFMMLNNSDSGSSLVSNGFIWLFFGLVILLLIMLLVVVRSSGAGSFSVMD